MNPDRTAWDVSPPGTSFEREGVVFTLLEDLGEKVRVKAQNNAPCWDPNCRECKAHTSLWVRENWVLRFEAERFGDKVLRYVSMPTWATPQPRGSVGLNFTGPDGTRWFFNVISAPVYASDREPAILVSAFLYDGEEHFTIHSDAHFKGEESPKTARNIAREIQSLLEGFHLRGRVS